MEKVSNNINPIEGEKLISICDFKNVINEDGGVNKGEVWLSGYVGDEWREDGLSMRNLKNYVISNNLKKVDLMLSTAGGYVHSAMEMVSYMQMQKDVTFRVVNVGIVASAGVLILVGGDKSEAVEGSLTMIHDPLFENWGGMKAKEMRKSADVLDKIKSSLMGVYISKMKKLGKVNNEEDTRKVLSDMMEEETWMTADEAKDMGFVNNVIESGKVKRDKIEVSNGINHKILNSLNYKNMSKVDEYLVKLGIKSPKKVEVKNEVDESVVKALALLKDKGYEVEGSKNEVVQEVVEVKKSDVEMALDLLKSKGYEVKEVKNEVVVEEKKVVNEDDRLGKIEAIVLKLAENQLEKGGVKNEVVDDSQKRIVKKIVSPTVINQGGKVVDEEGEISEGVKKDIFKSLKNGVEIRGKMDALASAIKG